MHNKILSLFNYNLESDFAKSILEQDSEINKQGVLIRNFTKRFPDNSFHVFDTISIKDFGKYSNIILSSKKYKLVKLYRYRKLINALHEIYGPDNKNWGKYSTQDFHYLNNKEFSSHSLRGWDGIENELLPCDINIKKSENLIDLTIFGAIISPEIKASW